MNADVTSLQGIKKRGARFRSDNELQLEQVAFEVPEGDEGDNIQ